jgi:hypothetical protein
MHNYEGMALQLLAAADAVTRSSVLMSPELSRQSQECEDGKMKIFDLMEGKGFEFFSLFSKLLMKIWSALNESCYFVCF